MSGPCDWPIVYSACANTAALDQMDPTDKELVEGMAVDLLWRWTRRAFGVCTLVLRPVVDCRRPATYWGNGPYTSGSTSGWDSGVGPLAAAAGGWLASGGLLANLACGCCGSGTTSCGCSALTVLKLPGPVSAVNSVTIDGVDLPAAGAWLLDNDRLVRIDGENWPTSQCANLPDTEVGTWSINFDWGIPAPTGGQVAAGLLAMELAKALCGDSSCQLPRRVTTITRQGISMAVLDGFDDLDKGRTGIWLIDSWVASVNSSTLRSSVRSPDVTPLQLRHAAPPPNPVVFGSGALNIGVGQ